MSNTFTEMPLNEVQQLAFTATKIPVKNVQNVVLPGSAQMSGSLSVVIAEHRLEDHGSSRTRSPTPS